MWYRRFRLIAVRAVALLLTVALVVPGPLEAVARAQANQRALNAAIARLGEMGEGEDEAPAPQPAGPKTGAVLAAEVLPVPLRPAAVAWLAPADAKNDPWVVFDGRASTGLELSTSGPVRIGVALGAAIQLAAATVLGPAEGRLTVFVEEGDGLHPALSDVELRVRAGEWKRVPVAGHPRAQKLTLEWVASSPTGPSEIGLWGLEAPRRETSDAELADRILSGAAFGGVTAVATPRQAHLARVELGSGAPTNPERPAIFHARVAADPRSFARAFLVYELTGLGHFTEALRQINGRDRAGGVLAGAAGDADGGLQVEEIDPAWLQQGDNEIRFLPLPMAGAPDYSVRNVRIVGSARGSVAETRLADDRRGEQKIAFDAPSQPHDAVFELIKPSDGQLLIRSVESKKKGLVRVDLHGLSKGWHHVDLDALGATEALGISLAVKKPLRVRNEDPRPVISEVAATASAVLQKTEDRRIVVSYPLHGECIDHKVQLRGFVTGLAEPEQVVALRANGTAVPEALGRDRAFALMIAESPSSAGRPWEISLEAALGDGDVLRRAVHVEPCLERAQAQDASLAEDEGAPFGEVVRAGEKKTIAFGGARLEIPEGAVDNDVRVTVRPLLAAQVPKMDALMRNVTLGRASVSLRAARAQVQKARQDHIALRADCHRVRHARERHLLVLFRREDRQVDPHRPLRRRAGGSARQLDRALHRFRERDLGHAR